MSNKVLYFPYINVPSSAWFTRMLLYWDNVASIVPIDCLDNPEELDDYTKELFQAGLVEQIFPGQYALGFPNFSNTFIDSIQFSNDLETRRKLFESGNRVRVHGEKLQEIAHALIDLRLAKPKDRYGWYSVEENTADEFMCYLATFLGRIPDLEYAPITDQYSSFHRLVHVDPQLTLTEREISSLRMELLERALPSPRSALTAYEILKFKEKHGTMLSRFRLEIETELTDLANIEDVSLRERALNILKEKIDFETNEIRAQMKTHGWTSIVFGHLLALVGETPVIGLLPKLLGMVTTALDTKEPINKNSPWAYAAFARKLQNEPNYIQSN